MEFKIEKPTQDSIKHDESVSKAAPLFPSVNLRMMLGCLLLIVVGFLLMSGGGSADGSFNPEVFSARRIIVGPALAFLGFLLMAFAIIWTPRKRR